MYERPEITETQKQKLIEYLDEARSKHMHMMYIAIAGTVLFFIPGIGVLGELLSPNDTLFVMPRSSIYFAVWIICVIMLAVLFLTGYQKKFGSHAPISCIKRGEYTCEYAEIAQLSDIQGRPPYLMTDMLGNQYVVPVYLECKQMRIGMRVIGVYAGNERFAMMDAEQMQEV